MVKKNYPHFDIKEMMEADDIFSYMAKKMQNDPMVQSSIKDYRNLLFSSIKNKNRSLKIAKELSDKVFNKFKPLGQASITDQEIANKINYIDSLIKEVEMIKLTQNIFENSIYTKLQLPDDVIKLAEQHANLAHKLIQTNLATYERLTQLFTLDRINKIREQITNGDLVADSKFCEDYIQHLDDLNMLYGRFIKELFK